MRGIQFYSSSCQFAFVLWELSRFMWRDIPVAVLPGLTFTLILQWDTMTPLPVILYFPDTLLYCCTVLLAIRNMWNSLCAIVWITDCATCGLSKHWFTRNTANWHCCTELGWVDDWQQETNGWINWVIYWKFGMVALSNSQDFRDVKGRLRRSVERHCQFSL